MPTTRNAPNGVLLTAMNTSGGQLPILRLGMTRSTVDSACGGTHSKRPRQKVAVTPTHATSIPLEGNAPGSATEKGPMRISSSENDTETSSQEQVSGRTSAQHCAKTPTITSSRAAASSPQNSYCDAVAHAATFAAVPIGDEGNRVGFPSRRWPGQDFMFINAIGNGVEKAEYHCEDCSSYGREFSFRPLVLR